jgi:hypothetical protein
MVSGRRLGLLDQSDLRKGEARIMDDGQGLVVVTNLPLRVHFSDHVMNDAGSVATGAIPCIAVFVVHESIYAPHGGI